MFFGFIIYLVLVSINQEQQLVRVDSPIEFILEDGSGLRLSDYITFDSTYSERNKELSKKLEITEDEAFIFGNLGKYWAKNLLEGRKIRVENGDILYYKFGYVIRFEKSPFCIKNGELTNKTAFNNELKSLKRGKFVIQDLDRDISYPVSKENWKKVKNYVVVRQSQVKASAKNISKIVRILPQKGYVPVYSSGDVKIIVSDLTTQLLPNRNCTTVMCKEILENINRAQNTIDMAIYGYSSTPAIEKAIDIAKTRGVKIRVVYDIDSKGNNIYPDTQKFVKLVSGNKNDSGSKEVNNTMHNKFYIFDNKTVITGSANLSHTDMSGYNTNAIIVINSPKIAKFYTDEFNQMYSGKFHNDKKSIPDKKFQNIQVFFSPQDITIQSAIIPLIKNSKKSVYISAFVITEKNFTNELINAKNRGVDVKIIADSLNASTKHSKHKELRNSGIGVKAENYAGKMHSKTITIDDEYIIIGSMNFSNSGEARNDENVIILKDSAAVKFYNKFFSYQWGRIPDKWLKYTPRAEGRDSVGSCSDGLDNNYDGYTDAEDVGCKNK